MRIHVMVLAITLTTARAALGAQSAQTPPATPPATAPATALAAESPQTPPPPLGPTATNTSYGYVDAGARGSSISGDDARYNRYRDMGDGAVVDFFRSQFQHQNWFVAGNADHVGREDQRYQGIVTRPGLFKGWGFYDQIPMLMSRTTETIYTTPNPGEYRIDNATQLLLQNTPSAQRPAVMGQVVSNQALAFETSTTRKIGDGGFELTPDRYTTLRFDVQHTNRNGVIPFGATFGFSNAIELPVPTQYQFTDITANAERLVGHWIFQGGYFGQWFNNSNQSIVWDNPYQAVDSTTAPSQGRLALAPSNSYFNVNGTATVTMPKRSRATAYVAFGVLDANAQILPQTINTALPAVPLDRQMTEGHAHTKAANLTFTSHPSTRTDVDVRYRFYDYVNMTPIYTQTARISYDTSYTAVSPPDISNRYGGARQWLDADVLTRLGLGHVGIGYSLRQANYDDRIFASSAENTLRLRYDVFQTQRANLRSKYEHSVRRGSGLDTTDIAAAGEQPGMRYFDISDRNRDLFTLMAGYTATSTLSFNVSAGAGHDDFPNSQFGQFSGSTQIYSAGVDYIPNDLVSMSASYDYQSLKTLQWSRQANPGVQFTDPSRDWSTTGHDRSDSVLARLDFHKIHDRVDVMIAFDYNHANTLYTYGLGSVVDRTLPEGSPDVPTTLPPPSQLPPVWSEVTRGTLDATYALTSRVSLGFRYWYDRYRVDDFALDAQAIPRIDLPNALLIGYQYLPYTANTFWGRLIVRW